jgi:hypothetical protein
MDKHSNLLWKFVNSDRKSFIRLRPGLMRRWPLPPHPNACGQKFSWGTRDVQYKLKFEVFNSCSHAKHHNYKFKLRTINMVGPKLVKFLSSSNNSGLYWSYDQIIFPTGFTNQGVSISMLQWLDGARWFPRYFGKSFDKLKN